MIMRDEINNLFLKYGRENVLKYIDEIVYSETYNIAYNVVISDFSKMKDVFIEDYNVMVFVPVYQYESKCEIAKNIAKTEEEYNVLMNWQLYCESYCSYNYIDLNSNELYVNTDDFLLHNLKYTYDLKNSQIIEIYKRVMLELYNMKDVKLII